MMAQSSMFPPYEPACSHADRLTEIRSAWEDSQVLIDPHTADAVHVTRQLLASGQVTGPVVVLETALPVKFSQTITEATGIVPPRPDRFDGLPDRSDVGRDPFHVPREVL